MTDPQEDVVSKGVEELIARLRDDGVQKGRDEAARIVGDAEERARALRREAERESEAIVQRARAEAEEMRRAGEQALRVASRDAVLSLVESLEQRFRAQVARMVGEALESQSVLERMVVEVAGRVRPAVESAGEVEILLPQQALDLDALRREEGELDRGTLTHFVRAVARDVLRDGVALRPAAERGAHGLSIRLDGDAVRIELDEHTVAAVVLEHLQPRFRAYLQDVSG
ncbi:MAG: hypothetical protein IPM29_01720 [Planctomycetes bacterium]|nr:hypothetical protein [Planctomycetota bacterium]